MAATTAQHAHSAAGAQPADSSSPPVSLVGSLAMVLRFSCAMAVALTVASLPASALFAVREITVQGAESVPHAVIAARSGIRLGDPRFAVSPSETARAVETLPRIQHAWIHLTLDGRVTIEVVERAAHAAVPFDGRYLVVDSSGVVIDSSPTAASLPVLTADQFSPFWMRFGDRLPDESINLALDALRQIPESLAGPGTKVRADALGEITLVTADGITVRLGALRGLRDRAGILDHILVEIRSRRLAVDYLDLRFAGNVVMKATGERR